VVIEPASKADLDPLVDLWVDLAVGQRAHGSSLYPEANRRIIRQALARHIVSDSVRVAREDGELTGFVMYSLTSGRYETDVVRGTVENLYVVPEARNDGIGAALLAAAEDVLRDRGATVVSLDVMADNEAARRFYREQGYDPSRIRVQKQIETNRNTWDES
jgi:ribosomal protein S18 acetylase RimI-like enzyme